jgi:hypothetical protein
MESSTLRYWIDIFAKLLIPIVIGFGGIWYSNQLNHDERERQDQRQIFDRDLEYAKLLIGTEQQRNYALRTLRIMVREPHFTDHDQIDQFSETLLPALLEISRSGQIVDTETGLAKNVLDIAASRSTQIKQIRDDLVNEARSAATANRPSAGVVNFFLRQASQSADYDACASNLRAAGYEVDKNFVDHGPNNNYVRFFNPQDQEGATRLSTTLSACMHEQVDPYNLSGDPESIGTPLNTFEVWFGAQKAGAQNSTAQARTPAAADQ